MDRKKQIISKLDNKNFVVDPVNISFGKLVILQDTKLVVNYGEHYGLVGKNGIGKTSLLNAIENKSLKVPDDLDIIYVKQEEPETKMSVIETLLMSNSELYLKNKKMLELEKMIDDDSNETNMLMDEYEVLCQEIGSEYIKSQIRTKKILLGLGFDLEQQEKSVSDFSGGWRMRISLAKALFMTPTMLILDEPTNHLDLHANIWLTEYLKSYPKTIILVSHDKYLIDEVCTIIIDINNKKLDYYNGNYDKFQKQLEIKKAKIKKDYLLFEKKLTAMRRAQKSKTEIDVFIRKTNIAKPEKNYLVKINFLQPNIIKESYLIMENVGFGYPECEPVLLNINLIIEAKTRMAIVGKNGVGKSTLLKMITGDIMPDQGQIIRSPILKIGYYNQHFEQSLPMDLKAVDYLISLNTSIDKTLAHKYLSMFGLEPIHHSTKISELSGGQKARVKFASFGVIKPHLLLLDEPTNHLDIVTIDSLILALNNFEGAIILVTHNFDMITSLNADLWVIHRDILPLNIKLFKYPKDYGHYIQEIYNECDVD